MRWELRASYLVSSSILPAPGRKKCSATLCIASIGAISDAIYLATQNSFNLFHVLRALALSSRLFKIGPFNVFDAGAVRFREGIIEKFTNDINAAVGGGKQGMAGAGKLKQETVFEGLACQVRPLGWRRRVEFTNQYKGRDAAGNGLVLHNIRLSSAPKITGLEKLKGRL